MLADRLGNEHVAAIERVAEGEESDIAEAAPIESLDDSDTIPNEEMEGEEEEGDEDEAPEDEGDDGGNGDDQS